MDNINGNKNADTMIPLPNPNAGPAPVQPHTKKLLNGERIALLVSGALLLVVAVLLVVFVASSGRSAAAVVNQKASGLPLGVQQEIVQVSIPGMPNHSVLFYLSEEGMAGAVLQRDFSGYKALTLAGSLSMEPDGEKGRWATSGEYFNGRSYFVYGVLLDDKTRGVEVNGNPAVLVDTGEYRCWFYVGSGTLSIKSNSVKYIV